MHTRLGFAIAAHLDPDVLIIDEALAVGDSAFQRKAFDRIAELVRGSIPVVVVSHQLETIASLCTEAILLSEGMVLKRGTPEECITAYLGADDLGARPPVATAVVIEQLRVGSEDAVASGARIVLALQCAVTNPGSPASESVGIRIRSSRSGEPIFETSTRALGQSLPPQGRYTVSIDLQLNLPPGIYPVESFVWNHMAGRELAGGPSGAVQVRGGPEFVGTVQMNPRVHLTVEDSA